MYPFEGSEAGNRCPKEINRKLLMQNPWLNGSALHGTEYCREPALTPVWDIVQSVAVQGGSSDIFLPHSLFRTVRYIELK